MSHHFDYAREKLVESFNAVKRELRHKIEMPNPTLDDLNGLCDLLGKIDKVIKAMDKFACD